MSLSGSLSNNRDALIEANKIIKDLESEANELAESIGLDKDVILAAARSQNSSCLLYTSPSPRDRQKSRMPSSA